ncbi:MAG TPA: hypothetical protein PLG30_14195 [Bacteroidia bacterium]|nr:hypothetical protein [Bacteroidia bacterium]
MGKSILLGQSDTLTVTGTIVEAIMIRMDTLAAANNTVSAYSDILMDKIKVSAVLTQANGKQKIICSGSSNVIAMASTIGFQNFYSNSFSTKGIIRQAAGASAKEIVYKNNIIRFPVPLVVGRGERLDITVTTDTTAVTGQMDSTACYVNVDVVRCARGTNQVPFIRIDTIAAGAGSYQSSAANGVTGISFINKNVVNDLTVNQPLTSANVNSTTYGNVLAGNAIDALDEAYCETDCYNVMYASSLLMPQQDMAVNDAVVNLTLTGAAVTSDNNSVCFIGYCERD